MPVKRRLGKARSLDRCMIEDMFYGPGSGLLAGEGYFDRDLGGFYFNMDEAGQAEIQGRMRADWQRFSGVVMAAWAERTDHDLYIAREYYGDPDQPWALTEFGDP